jgi:leucyl-tRNA synthetase
MEYRFKEIEQKWRTVWQNDETYKVFNASSKPKYYVLDMFPYPSGAGLHVGHPFGYIASDIVARYKRLKGYNVLHPMGFDTFGLPAEQYAIQTGQHPSKSTNINVQRYKEQLDLVGFSFDWSREVQTCAPKYYATTQWIFSQLFKHYFCVENQKAQHIDQLISTFESQGNINCKAYTDYTNTFSAEQWKNFSAQAQSDILMHYRLAYRKFGTVNWCPALGTVLANDEVKEGKSERGGYPVIKKEMPQWYLRITAYAERLLNDINTIDWPESTKEMQRNWIGKSIGTNVFFEILNSNNKLEIFTSRIDTIFGVTFMVIAPEHNLVNDLTSNAQKKAVEEYLQYVQSRSELDRMSDVKTVTGVFTGAYCIHPFTKKQIPIYIGEYVLAGYGTGAIMAVPSDDDRDFAFAQKFNLDIIDVVDKSNYPNSTKHDKEGIIINSEFLNGLEVPKAIQIATEKIEEIQLGFAKINYKFRDAGFSRQRYWGEPFPIFYKNNIPQLVPEEKLPLILPDLHDFKPTGEGDGPLAKLDSWKYEGYPIETDTMPGYAGSSWYYLAYMNENGNDLKENAIEYWQNVDLYIGGSEHAVGHLLYARMWHKFLKDIGKVKTDEPFKKLLNQGMIQGRSLVTKDNQIKKLPSEIHIPISLCDEKDRLTKANFEILKQQDSRFENVDCDDILWEKDDQNKAFITLKPVVEKMSKSLFNVVNPDEVIAHYGADCFRLYEMFLGPIDQAKPWDTQGIEGVSKFLRKFWSLFYLQENMQYKWNISYEKATNIELKVLHKTIKKINEDIERISLNTCVSTLMICVNELKELKCNKIEILRELLIVLSPFAPFISAELWEKLNEKEQIFSQNQIVQFPVLNESILLENAFTYPIMIDGKKRTEIEFELSKSVQEIENEVKLNEIVLKWTIEAGRQIQKIIIVPKKIVNIVSK